MRRWHLCLAAGLLAGLGCRERLDPNRYFPSEPVARQAVQAALEGWRTGRESAITLGTARVMFADGQRKPGQRLKRFAVLGETPGDAPRCYSVRLYLDEPAEEVRVRYVVLGLDPILVERHEDYLMWLRGLCATDDTGVKSTPSTAPSPRTDTPGQTKSSKP
jgi:hypothetical protein